MPHTYLISGTSRGLGLGLLRYLLSTSKDTKVVAGARDPAGSPDLQALVREFGKDRLFHLKLDVENAAEVKCAISELESSGFLGDGALDTLIANAGISNALPPPSETTPELVQANLKVNLYGVMNVVAACLPLLRKGQAKQIFALAHCEGPFSHNSLYTAYCMSKTILNMYMRKLSVELESEGFTTAMYSPGFVKTNLTGGYGDMDVDESVKLGVENVIRWVKKEDNGKFFDVDGSVAPW